MRDVAADDIARLRDWWARPDRINGWTFADWLNVALEEHFVLDALALYPHPGLDGRLHSLEVISGDTVKPLLDHRGAVPQPPDPAFQQILHGFPRGEFTASAADGQYTSDTLLYRPRFRRAHSPYGLSNTEQAIVAADLYLKRQEWLRAEYSSGVTPEMLVEVDAPLTPEQLYAYERVFNDDLSGRTADRHRARFLPQGFKPNMTPGIDQRYKADLDEYMVRIIGLMFDVMPTEMGFAAVGKGGLGGKGVSDAEENVTYRKATRPTCAWLSAVLDEVSRGWLGAPNFLTFQFLGLESEDEAAAISVLESEMSRGLRTVNEGRDARGLPRYAIPEADMPLIMLTREVIPLEGVLAASQAQQTLAGAAPAAEGPMPGALPSTSGAKSAEVDTFKAYVRNHRRSGRAWRDFQFTTVDPEIGQAANLLAGQGEWQAAVEALRLHR